MQNFKLFSKIVKKLMTIIAVTLVTACTNQIPTPNPQYNFTPGDPNASIVAFTLSCSIYDIPTDKATVYIDHSVWIGNSANPHEHFFPVNCDNFPEFKPNIEILMLPAGEYVISGIQLAVTRGNYTTTYFSKTDDKFYFTLKPHKLTYIGKITYEVTPSRVISIAANEKTEDGSFNTIKDLVPMISPHDYIITTWKKNWLHEIVAQEQSDLSE